MNFDKVSGNQNLLYKHIATEILIIQNLKIHPIEKTKIVRTEWLPPLPEVVESKVSLGLVHLEPMPKGKCQFRL